MDKKKVISHLLCLKISFKILHSMPHHVPRMMMMMFCSCSCLEFVWYFFFFVVDLLSSCYFNSAIPGSPVMLLLMLCDLHNTCIIIQFSSSVWFSTATPELLLHHILFFSPFLFFKRKDHFGIYHFLVHSDMASWFGNVSLPLPLVHSHGSFFGFLVVELGPTLWVHSNWVLKTQLL